MADFVPKPEWLHDVTDIKFVETTEFPFRLAPGDESIQLAHGWSRPDQVYLVDLRRRRVYLEHISVDDFAVLGRRYNLSNGEAPVHIRGMPRYYCVRDMVMWLWPVPAHAWEGALVKEEK